VAQVSRPSHTGRGTYLSGPHIAQLPPSASAACMSTPCSPAALHTCTHKCPSPLPTPAPHLENVVLDGAGQQLLVHALFLRGHDVHGEHGQHRAVHGHGDGHLVERDAVEQDLHVLHSVHGHASHAYVALHARVVGVVPAVRGEVERHGQALLARRQVLSVKGVGLLRRAEARVLQTEGEAKRCGEGLGCGPVCLVSLQYMHSALGER
jgi:hypothetical protein